MVEIIQIRHEHQSSVQRSRSQHMTYVVFFRIYEQFPGPDGVLEHHNMYIYGDIFQKVIKHQT